MMTIALENKLKRRRDESFQKKEDEFAQIKKLQLALQKLFQDIPRRPRQTLEELDQKISSLEHKRTITSVSLAEERQILKEIDIVKKSKTQLEEYHAILKRVEDTKIKLNDLRDRHRMSTTSFDEIEAALSKVKLANKLGCKTQDLTSMQIDCPQDKIGMVIGKNGSMVKRIMESSKVTINKNGNTLDITGSQSSVQQALAEIDKITRAVDEEFEMPVNVHKYVMAKRIGTLSKLWQEYADVYVDISRKSKKATLSGLPERVDSLKNEILAVEVTRKDRQLTGREIPILIGRNGATIDELVSKYEVAIEVVKSDNTTATTSVIGPQECVDAAMNGIEELLKENRDVIKRIAVDFIVRRILLADGGKNIKLLQNKVNDGLKDVDGSCRLSFGEDQMDTYHSELLVKAKSCIVTTAYDLTESGLKEYSSLVVQQKVDPYVIPRIIGKGGETIKKLTKNKDAFVEVEGSSGKVFFGVTNNEAFDALQKAVKELIESNQVIRISADAVRAQYNELNRCKAMAKISPLARLDIDENNGCFILRGEKENIEEAKKLIDEFLKSNHLDEMSVTEDDLEALLAGGKDSKLVKLSQELDVNLLADRSRYAVTLQGSPERVEVAKQSLNQFLNGGDGHSVAKLRTTEQLAGVVIGKGGKTRQQLEERFCGVSVFIHKSNRISIHGPDDKVADCRVEILKLISCASVSQNFPLSEEQHATLKKEGTIKGVMKEASVKINISGGKATIKGLFRDVRDAVSLLNEQLTGEYKASIELDSSQLSKVRSALCHPSHFERIESATNAKVTLDNSDGTIVMSGKRSSVTRAKDEVFDFLSFVLPGEIGRVKITRHLYNTVGHARSLAEISILFAGSTVYLDRDLSSIIITSTDPEKVKKSIELLNQRIKDAEKLAFAFEFQDAEAWLLPIIIGRNGDCISSLRQESGCHIVVSTELCSVTVTGDSEESVEKAKDSLLAIIEKARRENVFMVIPENAMALFVGREGSRIKKFAIEHEVNIQQRKYSNKIKITGQEIKIEAAKRAVEEWIENWRQTHVYVEMPFEKRMIPLVLGQRARAIQSKFGCRIDVDSQASILRIRGGDEENCENALKKIQEVIAKEKEAEREASAQIEETSIPASGRMERNHSHDSTAYDEKKKQFPSQPVGVESSKRKVQIRPKKVDYSVHLGTEEGRNLFHFLVRSEPATDKVPDSVPCGKASTGATDDETTISES